MNPATRRKWSLILKWIFTVLLVGACAGTWVWQCQRKGQEVQKLPDQERRALYERTLETLRTTCAHPPGPEIRDYCYEQADLILRFPECDNACEQAVKRLEPRATR